MSEEMADVRAIALEVFADNFYWRIRDWKLAQINKLALQKLCEIYERFLAKFGDALSEEKRKKMEERVKYIRDHEIKEAEEVTERYYKRLVEIQKEVEKLLGESLCLE